MVVRLFYPSLVTNDTPRITHIGDVDQASVLVYHQNNGCGPCLGRKKRFSDVSVNHVYNRLEYILHGCTWIVAVLEGILQGLLAVLCNAVTVVAVEKSNNVHISVLELCLCILIRFPPAKDGAKPELGLHHRI